MSKGSSTPVERGDSRVSSDLWIVPTQRVPGKALSGKYSQPAPCSRVESNRWVPRNPYVPFDGGGVGPAYPQPNSVASNDREAGFILATCQLPSNG